MTTPPEVSRPTAEVTEPPAGGATAETRSGLLGTDPAGWRHAALIAGLGLCTVIPFYAWLANLQSQGRSAAAIDMASMHMDRMGVFWAFPVLQATGIAALIWAYVGVALGLAESGRSTAWWPMDRREADRLHRHISLLVIALIAAHALATAYDAMGDGFATVLIPGRESWTAARWSYDLGIIAFYLALLLGPSYYLRRRLGARVWRFAHRFTLVVYILSVWHTLIIGADVELYGWVRAAVWLAQIPLLLLLARRLVQPAARPAARNPAVALRNAFAAVSLATAVGVLGVVVSGYYPTLVHSIQ